MLLGALGGEGVQNFLGVGLVGQLDAERVTSRSEVYDQAPA